MSMMVAWINVHTAWMLVNLKTSNNIMCIFFCHERKATRVTTAKGTKRPISFP